MNPIYVFAKTDAGEDAVVQRTRLVQRNLRTVLILVDGKSTVEELVEKAGSAEMVTLALDQLEKDGFIRRVGTGARKEAKEAKASRPAAAKSAAPVADSDFGNPPSLKPQVSVEVGFGEVGAGAMVTPPPAQDVPTSAPPPKAPPPMPASPFAASPAANPAANPFAAAASSSVADFSVPGSMPTLPSAGSPFQTGTPTPFGTSPFGTSPATVTPKPVAQAKAEPVPVEAPHEVPRSVRAKKKWLTASNVFGALAALLVVAGLVVVFYPYANYQPKIEDALTKALGQKVRVGSVRASFVPVPALVLTQLSVGEGAQITVGEVRAIPTLLSLLGGKRSFSRITLANAVVPMEQLGILASGLGSAAKGDSYAVGGFDFSGMTIGLRDISLSGYAGRAELSADGQLKRMELISPDQTMKVGVETSAGKAQVNIEATNWKPGETSPYIFDSLSIVGEISGSRLLAQKIEGRIFGGVIQGQMALDWTTGMAVTGDVSVDYMSAALFGNALGTGKTQIEGQANARVRFRASGASWNALAGKVPLEGDVILKGGTIDGMDLVEAVRRGSKLAMRGGTTRFEQAVGKFRWDGQALQLSDIDLSSGIMRATGSMGVLRGEQISGVMNVSLKGSAATVATPVSIVGTLKDPQLYGGRRSP